MLEEARGPEAMAGNHRSNPEIFDSYHCNVNLGNFRTKAFTPDPSPFAIEARAFWIPMHVVLRTNPANQSRIPIRVLMTCEIVSITENKKTSRK